MQRTLTVLGILLIIICLLGYMLWDHRDDPAVAKLLSTFGITTPVMETSSQ